MLGAYFKWKVIDSITNMQKERKIVRLRERKKERKKIGNTLLKKYKSRVDIWDLFHLINAV